MKALLLLRARQNEREFEAYQNADQGEKRFQIKACQPESYSKLVGARSRLYRRRLCKRDLFVLLRLTSFFWEAENLTEPTQNQPNLPTRQFYNKGFIL